MAKRSKRRNVRQNKDQGGCMWGLISMFDFRHGRTTRRLLSDNRRHMTKKTIDPAYPSSEVNSHINSEEIHPSTENDLQREKSKFGMVETKVKELMEEEMLDDQVVNVKNHKHIGKKSKKSFDFQEISNNHQIPQKNSRNRDLEALKNEMLLIYQKRNNLDLDLDQGSKSNMTFSIVEEKLSAAIETFMNESSIDENPRKIHQSKDFIDTFQMLSSNKELFLKLIQDQMNKDQKSKSNSNSIARSNSLENEKINPSSEEPMIRKHRNFFRRRSKSQECLSLNNENDSTRIVVLKPEVKMENEVLGERNISHFSFMEIKKRLKNAMKKEVPTSKFGEKTVFEGISAWSSPNRDHFYTEKFAKISECKMGDGVSKIKKSNIKITENNIYIEAKKHLSEMLSNGDEDTELMMGSLPKSLGRILSFPEYKSLSPRVVKESQPLSPCVVKESQPLSPRVVKESQPCLKNDNLEEKMDVTDEVLEDSLMGDTSCSIKEEMSPKEAQEIVKSPSPDIKYNEEIKVFDVSCESCRSLTNVDVDREILEVSDQERSPKCLKLDITEENELSCTATPSSPMRSKTEELEPTAGRPSPISVLEPLFSDDDISPSSTVSRPVKDAVQPLCIEFDEICISNCKGNEESAFEYVEAVLLSSDLDWVDFEKRWLSSLEILDPSIFEEVKDFSSQPSQSQRLLFDSTNEMLKEVCDFYLGFFLDLSFTKRNIRQVPKGMNLINNVWERIESRINNVYPRSLDLRVKKDLKMSKTWMDLRSETQEIVIELQDLIFQDLMENTLSTVMNDMRHKK